MCVLSFCDSERDICADPEDGVFFVEQKTEYEVPACLVGSEICIRDSHNAGLENSQLCT